VAASASPDGEPRFVLFDWGSVGGVLAGTISYALVFDESDEIVKPDDQRSSSWRRRVLNGKDHDSQQYSILQPNNEDHYVGVERMEGHFYLVWEYFR
jgi:hypothetical protein